MPIPNAPHMDPSPIMQYGPGPGPDMPLTTVLPPIAPLFNVGHSPRTPQFSPPSMGFTLGRTSNADIHHHQDGEPHHLQKLSPIAVGHASQSTAVTPSIHGAEKVQGTMAEDSMAGGAAATSAKRPPPPLDTMRAYRACLNCRGRKSKCDLDINQGRPVCLVHLLIVSPWFHV